MTLFFAIILVLIIQMIGMFTHRIMTLGHIVSTTNISLGRRKKNFDVNKEINKNGVAIVKSMIKNISVIIFIFGHHTLHYLIAVPYGYTIPPRPFQKF